MRTVIEYTDGRVHGYTDVAPKIDLEEQTITLCDDQSGVIDELKSDGVSRVIFEAAQ